MNRCTLLLASLLSLWGWTAQAQVRPGADLLFREHTAIIDGKRIGLVTNHSALLSDGSHLADRLSLYPNAKLVALFGPEHGIRGDAPDGEEILNGVDRKTGARVFSLYGATNKPTPGMMQGVDVLIYDIQDVGVRFYTYISTLSYAMEAAAESGIPFVVLDRPNPIRGTWIEGFIREDTLRSFVGLHPIPIAHGMTVGELATMFNDEGWLAGGVKANLTVVRMEGWRRSMWYDETGLRWIRPSPNMATLSTAVVYPGTCLVEGTSLSEGRGTERPFEYLGAPFIDGKRWAKELNAAGLPGVRFEPIEFTPRVIPNVTTNPKHQGMKCEGVYVRVTDRELYEPVKTGIYVLVTAKRIGGDQFQWRIGAIDRLSGTARLRTAIDRGEGPAGIVQMWKKEVEEFKRIREQYLLY